MTLQMELNFEAKITKNANFEDIQEHVVKKFWVYHQENPHVYQLFKKYAFQIKQTGRGYYGAQAIMERIRWHVNIETSGDEFKINNDYASCYARLLVTDYPEFKPFFQFRRTDYRRIRMERK